MDQMMDGFCWLSAEPSVNRVCLPACANAPVPMAILTKVHDKHRRLIKNNVCTLPWRIPGSILRPRARRNPDVFRTSCAYAILMASSTTPMTMSPWIKKHESEFIPPPLSDLNTHLQGRIFTSPLPYTQLEIAATKVVTNGMQILKNFIAVAFANNEPLPL